MTSRSRSQPGARRDPTVPTASLPPLKKGASLSKDPSKAAASKKAPKRYTRARVHSPSREAVRQARLDCDMTQTEAAEVVHSTLRTWQQWEAGDRRMHAGLWELFEIKTGRKPLEDAVPGATG